MKKIISMMMIAAMAIFAVACDSSDDNTNGSDTEYGLTGDKYIGTMTVASTMTQEDITFYIDADDQSATIMMPGVSFMVGLMPSLDMALTSIPLTSQSPDTYFSETSQMVGIYDHLPLINDVIQSITNVEVVISDNNTVVVSFDCDITTEAMGDMVATVVFEGLLEGAEAPEEETTDPEFSMDNEEGFYITTSSGATLLQDVTITYYKGNQALVIDGFSFSAYLAGTVLPIIGVSEEETNGLTTLTGDDIDVSYTFMGSDATGTVSNLTCEIIDNDAQFVFTISAAMGGSGEASEYPCSYNGEISIEEGSYSAE